MNAAISGVARIAGAQEPPRKESLELGHGVAASLAHPGQFAGRGQEPEHRSARRVAVVVRTSMLAASAAAATVFAAGVRVAAANLLMHLLMPFIQRDRVVAADDDALLLSNP